MKTNSSSLSTKRIISCIVYVGLGSNLDDPIYQVEQGLQALDALPTVELLTHSSLYRSAPLGPQNQPDYINAVAMLTTKLSPFSLLEELQSIENKRGRVRSVQRWGPRTLDLDMLLYDNEQSSDSRLTLPHPGLYERAFVLYPLYECAPNLTLPNGQHVNDLMQNCQADNLHRL